MFSRLELQLECNRFSTSSLSVVTWSSLDVFYVQVMLLGDSGVGKTCLLVRFKDKTFLSGSFIATVGIDFRVRNDIKPVTAVDAYYSTYNNEMKEPMRELC